MPAYIYLIQVHITDQTMYKIGMCKQVPCNYIKRLKSYPYISKICLVYLVPETLVDTIEAQMICMMKISFNLVQGNEYFEGNENEIILACVNKMHDILNSKTFEYETNDLQCIDKPEKPSLVTINYEEIKAEIDKALQMNEGIRLDMVSRWLDANKNELSKTLKKTYCLNHDYVITKDNPTNKKDPRANNNKVYILTPNCFKRIVMLSRSRNAEMLRNYFINIVVDAE